MSHELLDKLEAQVQNAADRIATLRETNLELEQRITELEAELATARDGGAAEAWQIERAELQGRVERLVARLEDLLEG